MGNIDILIYNIYNLIYEIVLKEHKRIINCLSEINDNRYDSIEFK